MTTGDNASSLCRHLESAGLGGGTGNWFRSSVDNTWREVKLSAKLAYELLGLPGYVVSPNMLNYKFELETNFFLTSSATMPWSIY